MSQSEHLKHGEQLQRENIPRVVLKKILRAKRERVFAAWTKPELMSQWFTPADAWSANTKIDLRVGGSYAHEMVAGGPDGACNTSLKAGDKVMHSGEYLEIIPPEKIVFTWNTPSVQNTRVTVELRDLGEETELWLTHEFLPTEELRKGHTQGWQACTDHLEQFLARVPQ